MMVRLRPALMSATCMVFFCACAFAAHDDRATVSESGTDPSTYEAVGNFSGPRPTIDLFEDYLAHGNSGDNLETRLGRPESRLSFFLSSRDGFYAVDAGSHVLPLFRMDINRTADFSERQYSCHPTKRSDTVHLACRSSSGSTYEITYEDARGITSFDYLCDIISLSTCRYVLVSPKGFLSARMIDTIKARRTGGR